MTQEAGNLLKIIKKEQELTAEDIKELEAQVSKLKTRVVWDIKRRIKNIINHIPDSYFKEFSVTGCPPLSNESVTVSVAQGIRLIGSIIGFSPIFVAIKGPDPIIKIVNGCGHPDDFEPDMRPLSGEECLQYADKIFEELSIFIFRNNIY